MGPGNMNNNLKFDIGMIGFGVALLLWQRVAMDNTFGGESTSGQKATYAAMAPVTQPVPEWELTIPADSKYQNLTPPQGVSPNPFTLVERLAREAGPVRDYAGKDNDMRLLLAKHEKEDYYFILQQQAANEMLRHELFHHFYKDPTNPHMLASLAFYTQQLLDAQSDDAKLVYMSLRALKGYWTKKQIAQAAALTAQRVQARSKASGLDTTTVHGYYRHVYARELKKLTNKLKPALSVDKPVDNLVYNPVDKDSDILSSAK